jgi:hypothetical protein
MEQGINKFLSIVRGYAQQCLADLRASDEFRSEVVVESDGKLTVVVVVFPTPTASQRLGLTDCEKTCLALLAQATEPISAPQLRRELEERNIGIWAEVTVKRALLQLARLGLVCGSRRKPRGYWLADKTPLFPR